jgi:hypothetical protein
MIRALLVVALALPAVQHKPLLPPPDPKDMIVIDGAKEPHRIPQWNAWGFAFRIFTTMGLPPTLTAITTPADRELLLRFANDEKKNQDAYTARMTELYPKVLEVRTDCDREHPADQSKADKCFITRGNILTGPSKEDEIAVRQRTLDIRDELLIALDTRAELKLALIAYVDKSRAGIKSHMHKLEEARYRKPQ